MQRRFLFLIPSSLILLAVATMLSVPAVAASSATITATLQTGSVRSTAIPSDFEGLSFEMTTICKTWNGTNWMSSSSTAFANLLKRLGVKSLRIGGNSGEEDAYPTASDAQDVNDFANLIGANLIWLVPGDDNYNVSTYTNFVKAMQSYKSSKGYSFSTTIEIGNETDAYNDGAISESTYDTEFTDYTNSIRANVSPIPTSTGPSSAKCCGWAKDLANDWKSKSGDIGFITAHDYPAGEGDHISSVSQADTDMLQSSINSTYSSFYSSLSGTPLADGLKPRIEETNSISEGGYSGATDAYAQALWVADYYSYYAYDTEIAGLNMHNGGGSSYYNTVSPIGYASSYAIEPAAYGLLTFAYNGQGNPMPVTLSNPSNVNFTAYALKESNGTYAMHAVNRTYGSGATNVTLNVSGAGFSNAQIMYLKQANGDVTATSGITLGGQPINSDGTWTGGYTNNVTPSGGVFSISVPAAEVAVIHFYN
jgi:hypothetical protein